ncbi:HAMP domain-containing sensor histidine kinase [Desulforamulus ruminis]|uniref:histidine kinase n=1 Tax=Desulforamulus ruminis (strain ATCC 23193 / DSM 2154 / NCIMB 8452 / DL) TaxID=696281 RepID=F6DQD2_DESRL|nr:HAMP domain-containing sensor histidine kinase [Desulforamulus ruminis]AEG59710.1 ATP-binding region ATPase domain protein [Desulforamulus ruminis DSM 2154]
MRGIRGRLTANFMIVILVSVAILEVMLIYTVQQNYYGSLRGNLTNQVKISADMYSKYYSDTSLEDNILYNVDAFWNQSNAEVEIVDRDGKIVMDSLGLIPEQGEPTEDIQDALNDKMGEWVGKLNGQKVMAVAYPLKSEGQIVGALRFIASTAAIDQDIQDTAKNFIAIGLFVVLVVGLLSIFLANTILVPLREVTAVAESMAAGNFQIKSKKKRDDEIGKLSDTLNYMADEITKKEKLKNDFISSVSHELRTPLTSIMGWAITLQSEKFQHKEMLNDGLGIIAKETKRLTRMVEELLDFSKFVSGRIKLEYENVNLTELMEHIRKQLMPRALRDNIHFTVDYPEGLPDLMTDANRLKQVLINILDNALNFTSAGGSVHFQVQVGEKEYTFTIADSGCGITAEELPMVKEKFYKGRSSRSKNGIGLSICEEIVTLMKGRLEISSEVNVGTTVVITLPRGVRANG